MVPLSPTATTPQLTGLKDNDWVEAYNRNGVMACRATVSHRIPKGVCLMYHAKDRHRCHLPDQGQRVRGGRLDFAAHLAQLDEGGSRSASSSRAHSRRRSARCCW